MFVPDLLAFILNVASLFFLRTDSAIRLPVFLSSVSYMSVSDLSSLSHVGNSSQPKMVDVSKKIASLCVATAEGRTTLADQAISLLNDSNLSPTGSVLSVARLAAVMAVKQCSTLIPLCHTIPITGMDVFSNACNDEVVVRVTVKSVGVTGVEMEALTCASVALLTMYDMTKFVSHKHVIREMKLISKTGGKSTFST